MVPGLYLLAGIERRWRTRAKTPYAFPHFEDTRGERAAVDKERLPFAPDLLPVRAHAEFFFFRFLFFALHGCATYQERVDGVGTISYSGTKTNLFPEGPASYGTLRGASACA